MFNIGGVVRRWKLNRICVEVVVASGNLKEFIIIIIIIIIKET
jgi:hypothetical protein